MPAKPQSMFDLLVVIPGIMGSALSIDGKPVWGFSGSAIIDNLLSLGKNIGRLAVPAKIGDNDPNDGVTATHLLPDLHLLPGFWNIDGYGKLLKDLRSRFKLFDMTEDRPGNMLLFSYDWRLSNALSAKKLAIVADRELERWRKQTNNKNAKLVLICHSMGGLVARYFLEMLGGHELTRQLITIGTPYQGSVNALDKLVNGFSRWLGPLRDDLTKLTTSLPSLYQLLPTYPCLDTGDGKLQRLTQTSVPGLESDRVQLAADFHQKIMDCVEADKEKYEIIAIKGHVQPTAQSALLACNKIKPLNSYNGKNLGGDGTVPRPSSHPPEWNIDTQSVFAAQKHGSLQNTDGILHQLFGALTGRLGTWMGGDQIGVEIPVIINAGANLPVLAVSETEDSTLALQAVVCSEDNTMVSDPLLMINEGEGRYSANIKDLDPGCYRVTVESAVPQRPVDVVTDITLVWD